MRMLLLLAGSAALLYLTILAVLYLNQSRMVFYPDPLVRSVPTDFGMDFEDVEFGSGDETIHGWYVAGTAEAPVVLFCHGNAGNIAGRLDIMRGIHESGLSVLIFDYAGYGRSTGSPGEEQMYSDAEAAWDWLANKGYVGTDVIVYGRSLGGAVAAHLAAGRQPAALVLEATYTKLSAVAGRHYPWVPVSLLLKYSYPTVEYVREVQAPIIIVHSRDDELIPFDMTDGLLEAAGTRGQLLVSRGGHNTMPNLDWKAVLGHLGVWGEVPGK